VDVAQSERGVLDRSGDDVRYGILVAQDLDRRLEAGGPPRTWKKAPVRNTRIASAVPARNFARPVPKRKSKRTI
jgi:hypothetical protein